MRDHKRLDITLWEHYTLSEQMAGEVTEKDADNV